MANVLLEQRYGRLVPYDLDSCLYFSHWFGSSSMWCSIRHAGGGMLVRILSGFILIPSSQHKASCNNGLSSLMDSRYA
jgi:hypothetical protein